MRLLFIGNSFTARNDLPSLIEQLAAAQGVMVEHRLLSIGGASLRTHWNKGEAQKAISTGGYDVVVLQEQGTLPVKNAVRMHENVQLFDAVIRQARSKTVLYMTWARQNAPDAQAAITDAYRSVGKQLNATVVPVGEAWEQCLKKHGDLELHDRDGSHPTIAGTYLAACVFLRVLFKLKPPMETIPSGLAASDADVIRRLVAARRPARTRGR